MRADRGGAGCVWTSYAVRGLTDFASTSLQERTRECRPEQARLGCHQPDAATFASRVLDEMSDSQISPMTFEVFRDETAMAVLGFLFAAQQTCQVDGLL